MTGQAIQLFLLLPLYARPIVSNVFTSAKALEMSAAAKFFTGATAYGTETDASESCKQARCRRSSRPKTQPCESENRSGSVFDSPMVLLAVFYTSHLPFTSPSALKTTRQIGPAILLLIQISVQELILFNCVKGRTSYLLLRKCRVNFPRVNETSAKRFCKARTILLSTLPELSPCIRIIPSFRSRS